MALTLLVLSLARVPHRWAPIIAILRGLVQLAILSVILTGVITNGVWVALALLVMFGVATATATRRIGWSSRHLAVMAVSMGAGAVSALTIVFASGALDFTPRYALAIGGIVIGNTMSIATIGGRRFTETVDDRWDEVEGWIALGATPRQSTVDIAKQSIYAALIPTTDQTRTTGLVTLPGAFVGAIFGGVSPLEAGRFQIVVLASIMAAGSVTAVLLVSALAPVRVRPLRPA